MCHLEENNRNIGLDITVATVGTVHIGTLVQSNIKFNSILPLFKTH